MNNNESLFYKGFAWVGGIFAGIILLVVATLYGGWVGALVATHLWAWFVVPTFGLAPLKMSVAFGLCLLVSLWTHQHSKGFKEERSWTDIVPEYVGQLITPWFILLCGFVCHHFFM